MTFHSKSYPYFVGILAFVFLLANIFLFYKIFIEPQLDQGVLIGEKNNNVMQEYEERDDSTPTPVGKKYIVAKFTLNCANFDCCSFDADYVKAKIRKLTLVLNASVKDVRLATKYKWDFQNMKLDFIFEKPLNVAGPIAEICFNKDAVLSGFSINVELDNSQQSAEYKALLEIK